MLVTFWSSVALVFVVVATSAGNAVADFAATDDATARIDAIVHLTLAALVGIALLVGLPSLAPAP